jgi:hypothetical protein
MRRQMPMSNRCWWLYSGSCQVGTTHSWHLGVVDNALLVSGTLRNLLAVSSHTWSVRRDEQSQRRRSCWSMLINRSSLVVQIQPHTHLSFLSTHPVHLTSRLQSVAPIDIHSLDILHRPSPAPSPFLAPRDRGQEIIEHHPQCPSATSQSIAAPSSRQRTPSSQMSFVAAVKNNKWKSVSRRERKTLPSGEAFNVEMARSEWADWQREQIVTMKLAQSKARYAACPLQVIRLVPQHG